MTTEEEKIIYTDGHGIKITDRNFYTEKQTYLIEGITDVKLVKRPAGKWPGIILFLLGVAGLVFGSYEYLADREMVFSDKVYIVDTNTVLVLTGVLFILLGIIVLVAMKDRYVVRIRTAEGIRQPVKSKSREYATHIANQLRATYHEYFVPKKEHVHPVAH